ncbi:MAG: ABC transporter ATP-binding protein [Acidimicrobiia bacterium]
MSDAPSVPALAIRNLTVWYPPPRGRRRAGPVRAVDGVSLEVAAGESFGIVGESGSGKTTLARAALRLIAPTSGIIEIEGRDVTNLPESILRPLRRRIQPVFQDPVAALNPRMTIQTSLAHPLRVHHLASSRGDARRQVVEALSRVGLTPPSAYLDRRPSELSGGERQRAAIARALIVRPQILVADEPVAMLDASARAVILDLLARLGEEFSLTYLLVTHDLATARLFCDRLAVMYLGRVVESGPAREICDSPRHPYTRALLDAIPRPGRASRQRPVDVEPPDASALPSGCRFHPRCPAALPVCDSVYPKLEGDDREVACHLYP